MRHDRITRTRDGSATPLHPGYAAKVALNQRETAAHLVRTLLNRIDLALSMIRNAEARGDLQPWETQSAILNLRTKRGIVSSYAANLGAATGMLGPNGHGPGIEHAIARAAKLGRVK